MTHSPPDYLEQLSATAARLGACRSVLADVVILAGEAKGLTDAQLRNRLAGVAELAARQLGGEARCGHRLPAKGPTPYEQPPGVRHRTCPTCAVLFPQVSEPSVPVPSRGRNRLVIAGTCRACAGQMAIGFTNVVVSKLPDGQIEFDPHATGTHPFTVGEDAARRLADRVREWAG